MKTSKLAMVGMIGGFIFTMMWTIRYFFLYPDQNIALIGCLVGALIIAVSYLHDVTVQLKITQQNIEDGVANLYGGDK